MTIYTNAIGGDHQGPTFIVAAANSLHPGRADYVCDGTNDQVEFNAAVANGGHIVAVKGSYVFSSEVLLPSNTTLEFLAGSSIFVTSAHSMTVYTKNTDSFSAIITNADHVGGNENIKIIGADIDFNGDNGKSLNQGWAAIWLDNCIDSEVLDCVGYDVVYSTNLAVGRAYGILLSDCSECKITGCEGSHCGYEGIGVRGTCTHIYVFQCYGDDNVRHTAQAASWAPTITGGPSNIIFNSCYGNGDILIHGNPTTTQTKQVIIQNCMCLSVAMKGHISGGSLIGNTISSYIHLTDATDGDLKNILVDGNIIHKSSVNIGIWLQGLSTLGSINNITVTNNQLIESYILIEATDDDDLTGISVNNNNIIVSGTTHPGVEINISSTGNIINISITNNIFNNYTAYFVGIDIDGNGYVKNVDLSNNVINCRRFMNNSRTSGTGVIEDVNVTDNLMQAVVTTVFYSDAGNYITSVRIIDNNIIVANYLLAGTGGTDDITIKGNLLSNVNNILSGSQTNVVIRNNIGYVTENSGTDTIAAAQTSKAVTHGLSVTPAAGDIMVTSMESLGNASFFWVDTYTSTQFTIHTNAAPGADTDFAWKAIVL